MPGRRTDPIENMRSYIMVHGGVDRHDRLLDVEWINDVVKAARAINDAGIMYGLPVDEASHELEEALLDLRKVFNRA